MFKEGLKEIKSVVGWFVFLFNKANRTIFFMTNDILLYLYLYVVESIGFPDNDRICFFAFCFISLPFL